MTRITNFCRKRTYLEVGFTGFAEDANDATVPQDPTSNAPESLLEAVSSSKKKKRGKLVDGCRAQSGQTYDNTEDVPGSKHGKLEVKDGTVRADGREKTAEPKLPVKKKWGGNKRRDKRHKDRVSQSELRRQKRIAERRAFTTCFACREQGHAARDCPSVTRNPDSERKPTVGICYRCGSQRHTLSHCKKPLNTSNPLPFASCFVCSGKGHLASSCPQNNAKGIYPNGGCCKLCGDTTHLAKNCGLRKDEANTTAIFLGIGPEAGADEDDFHMFKRRNAEVEKDEKLEDRVKRSIHLKAGVFTGVVKSLGKPAVAPRQKVVYF